MKKLQNSSGFTLMELLAALMVLVLLVVGMDLTLSTATRVYRESVFESNSGSLSGILNNALGDVLRHSVDITVNPGTLEDSEGNMLAQADVGFVFTSYEYGVRNGYFYTPLRSDGSSSGTLQMKNLENSRILDLVNTGAYPHLAVTNFVITYYPPDPGSAAGGYFDISYDILDTRQPDQVRPVQTIVRLLNPET